MIEIVWVFSNPCCREKNARARRRHGTPPSATFPRPPANEEKKSETKNKRKACPLSRLSLAATVSLFFYHYSSFLLPFARRRGRAGRVEKEGPHGRKQTTKNGGTEVGERQRATFRSCVWRPVCALPTGRHCGVRPRRRASPARARRWHAAWPSWRGARLPSRSL